MSRSFTLKRYSELMLALMGTYRVMTVAECLTMPPADRCAAVLLHPVEKMPERAAAMALAEKRLGLRSTYYFRWDLKAVNWAGAGQERHGNFPELQVVEAKLYGHEVGYLPQRGEDAGSRLAVLRALAPVRTSMSEVADPNMLGGPFSPDFSEFLRLSDEDGWTVPGKGRKGLGSVAELLRNGEYARVLISIRPDLWK